MLRILSKVFILFALGATLGCKPAADLSLSTLVPGLELGMAQDSCEVLLRAYGSSGRIRPSKTFLPFEMDLPGMPHPAEISFRPVFENGQLNTVEVIIAYKAWAPWNRELFSEPLFRDFTRWCQSQWGVRLPKADARQVAWQSGKYRFAVAIRNEYQLSGQFQLR